MRTISYKPTWRYCNDSIQLVEDPTREWFKGLQVIGLGFGARRSVRFALMSDGTILWGDLHTVVHQDMCRCRNEHGDSPILIGVVVIDDIHNRAAVRMVQWFMGKPAGISDTSPELCRSWDAAHALLDRLVPWIEVEHELGAVHWPDPYNLDDR